MFVHMKAVADLCKYKTLLAANGQQKSIVHFFPAAFRQTRTGTNRALHQGKVVLRAALFCCTQICSALLLFFFDIETKHRKYKSARFVEFHNRSLSPAVPSPITPPPLKG